MKNKIPVLHLLRKEEPVPPSNLLGAADVYAIPAGSSPDGAVREHGPQVVTILAPMDFDAREAVERVAGLGLPVLSLGAGGEGVTAHATDSISAADLHMMLELMAALATCRSASLDEGDHILATKLTDITISMLEHMLTLRIPDYKERAARVYHACNWMATHRSLPDGELRALLRAARLREIGKLGLPDHILFTPRERRTQEEQSLYDRYPALGAHVLAEFPTLKDTAVLVGYQLENWDGSGPGHLEATQIPLGSRMLRIAGAFGMLGSGGGRVRTAHEAIDALERGRGSLYDPLLVKLAANYQSLSREGASSTCRVRLTDLKPGMVLAEDIWSRSGMKIIPQGALLSEHVLKILLLTPVDPRLESVEVMK